jgi:hypothetical protein
VDRIIEILTEFAEAVRRADPRVPPSFEELLDRYIATRAALAEQFADLARTALLSGSSLLELTLAAIQQRCLDLFDERVPGKYLSVSGYSGVHPILLEYLARHIGDAVSASRLRVFTGDQVHTERRVRELRDLGFSVSVEVSGGEQHYSLLSTDADLDEAARFRLEHNLKAAPGISATDKMLLLLKAELGRAVHTSRLKRLSGNQAEYTRRIRELRERFQISTGLNRAGLATDEYLLESLDERDPQDHFSPAILAEILERDDWTCRDCGWKKNDPERLGRRYLEAHHVQYRKAGGPSTVENGVTLCNICHDARHARGR